MATQTNSKRHEGTFAQILPEQWLEDTTSRFLIRGYPTFCYNYPELEKIFEGQIASLRLPWPEVRFGIAKADDPPILRGLAALFSRPSGQIVLSGAVARFDCGPTSLMYFVARFKGQNENEAQNSIERAAAWVALNFGANLASFPVLDGELNRDGTIGQPGNIVRSPDNRDCFDGNKEILAQKSDVGENYAELPNVARQRIDRALEHVHAALQELDHTRAFLSLWTAVEILCHGSNYRRKIHAIYRTYACSNLDDFLGLPAFKSIRDAIIHEGAKVRFHDETSVKRYIQYILLDLVRWNAGLPEKQVALKMREGGNLDLRSLGIGNDGSKINFRDHTKFY